MQGGSRPVVPGAVRNTSTTPRKVWTNRLWLIIFRHSGLSAGSWPKGWVSVKFGRRVASVVAVTLVAVGALSLSVDSAFGDAVADRCFASHRFGQQPVDVAKTADGSEVLAQVRWGYHDSFGCYLVLNDAATSVLRARGRAPSFAESVSEDPSDRCFASHRFGQQPVDVAKTADGSEVLAQVRWGYHDSFGCYLVLDDAAVKSLREAHLESEATDAAPPGRPGEPTVVVGDQLLVVSWSAPAAGGGPVTGYELQYRACSAVPSTCALSRSWGAWVSRALSGAGTTTSIGSLVNGVAYQVRVRAESDAGTGDWSVSAQGVPVGTPPGRPGEPTVVVGDQLLVVSWSAPAAGGGPVTGYELQYRACSAVPSTCALSRSWGAWVSRALSGAGTTTSIGSLVNGVAYQVRVRAESDAGTGDWSVSAQGVPVGTPPGRPEGQRLKRHVKTPLVNWP